MSFLLPSSFEGASVSIVGLGRAGSAAARFLLSQGARVHAFDQRPLEGCTAGLASTDCFSFSRGDPSLEALRHADFVVVSPGVPPSEVLRRAEEEGVPCLDEVELAAQQLRGKLIGVTGTNGKSTVVAWVGMLCAGTHRPTFVGGNIGTPLIEAVGTPAAAEDGIVVAELSSFQLHRTYRLRPSVAVMLDVSEDHLDWHGSFGAYVAAKSLLLRRQNKTDHALLYSNSALLKSLGAACSAKLRFFGPNGDIRVSDGTLVDKSGSLKILTALLPSRAPHDLHNACAAIGAALAAGVTQEEIRARLSALTSLPHRFQSFRMPGVSLRFVDDSKATNVGATLVALASVDTPLIWIGGGRGKGGDNYPALVEKLQEKGRMAVVLGETAEELERHFQSASLPCERVASMEEAVRMALSHAQAGDTILLSPACASWDMYASYVQRGLDFQHQVRSQVGRQWH